MGHLHAHPLETIKPALARWQFLTNAVTFVTTEQCFALPSGLQHFAGRSAGPCPRSTEQLVPGVCPETVWNFVPEFHAVGGFATCHQPQYPASFMLLIDCSPNVSSYVVT